MYRLYYLKDEPRIILYSILLYLIYVYVMTFIISVSRSVDKSCFFLILYFMYHTNYFLLL